MAFREDPRVARRVKAKEGHHTAGFVCAGKCSRVFPDDPQRNPPPPCDQMLVGSPSFAAKPLPPPPDSVPSLSKCRRMAKTTRSGHVKRPASSLELHSLRATLSSRTVWTCAVISGSGQ